MHIPRKRAVGHQGSWFATVDGESLPCVHERFLKKLEYHDPAEGVPLPMDYVRAIEQGTVILTKSNRVENGGFVRSGYIAIFRIEDFHFGAGQVQFRLAKRVAHLT